MTNPQSILLRCTCVGLIVLALPALAQIPNTLLHSIPAPPVGVQSGAGLGISVAMDGGYTVVGASADDFGEQDAGQVKVFDSTTGAMLFLLPNPSPGDEDFFGSSVAISGTRVVVGAIGDETGASNAGSAYVFDLASGTPTLPIATLNKPSPAVSDWFGHSVAISGTRVVVGAPKDNTGATDAGSAYVYDVAGATPTVPVFTLNNPGPATNDQFGYSVAISGTQVLVVAIADNAETASTGSLYVYDLAGGTPTVPVTTLNNPAPATNGFGWSVAIFGTRLVVGHSGDDTGADSAGSAHVYDLAGATPTVPVLTLYNPDPAAGDAFGSSVAISGTRLVVGAEFDDTGASGAGSAYVYDLASATPTVPVATLNNPGPAVQDYFGHSVAISGARVVAGAYQDDTGATNAGSAYVYDLTSGTPTVPLVTLNHPGPVTSDNFGHSVAISGTRLVVGAILDDTGAQNAGSAYAYDLAGGLPTLPVLTLNNPGPAGGDGFGNAVAIDGTQVVIGTGGDDTGATNSGSTYVYDLTSGTPSVPVVTLNNPGPATSDVFGISVAISGTHVVVGASSDDTGATSAGSAYVYDLTSGTPTVPVTTLNNPDPALNDGFAVAVAISGTRVVVGTSGDDTGASNAGSAYVYDLASGTPTVPVVTLNNPGPAANDNFGTSVAISGTRVVVGTPGDDTGAASAGSAYVYDLTSGTPTVPVATLNNPGPALNDGFGNSVAISGTRVVVGAAGDDAGAIDGAGRVFAYDLSSGTPTVPVATLTKAVPATDDSFGRWVAIDGITVAIGTPFDDTVMPDKGAAYIFGPIDGDGDGLRDPWEITHFGTQYGHGPLDDFDHDGYCELLELALGLNPTLTNPGGFPGVTDEGGYLTLTLTKQPGVTYEVQSAGTLLPALPDSFSPTTTTVLINDATTLKVRDNVLIGTPPSRFIRAKVTAAP